MNSATPAAWIPTRLTWSFQIAQLEAAMNSMESSKTEDLFIPLADTGFSPHPSSMLSQFLEVTDPESLKKRILKIKDTQISLDIKLLGLEIDKLHISAAEIGLIECVHELTPQQEHAMRYVARHSNNVAPANLNHTIKQNTHAGRAFHTACEFFGKDRVSTVLNEIQSTIIRAPDILPGESLAGYIEKERPRLQAAFAETLSRERLNKLEYYTHEVACIAGGFNSHTDIGKMPWCVQRNVLNSVLKSLKSEGVFFDLTPQSPKSIFH